MLTKIPGWYYLAIAITFLAFSCEEPHNLQGEYSCSDVSPASPMSEPVRIMLETSGKKCTYMSLNFTSNNTVIMLKDIINGQRIEYPITYRKAGNTITIPHQGVDLILKVESPTRIVGEGLAYGVYEK